MSLFKGGFLVVFHLLYGIPILILQQPSSIVSTPVPILLIGLLTGGLVMSMSSIYKGYFYFISCVALFGQFHLLYPSLQDIHSGLIIIGVILLFFCVYVGLTDAGSYVESIRENE